MLSIIGSRCTALVTVISACRIKHESICLSCFNFNQTNRCGCLVIGRNGYAQIQQDSCLIPCGGVWVAAATSNLPGRPLELAPLEPSPGPTLATGASIWILDTGYWIYPICSGPAITELVPPHGSRVLYKKMCTVLYTSLTVHAYLVHPLIAVNAPTAVLVRAVRHTIATVPSAAWMAAPWAASPSFPVLRRRRERTFVGAQ